MQAPSHYRPDIDGLRAIAVLAVVLYHAGFQTLSGGFIGVDIFFVISGYLITTILIRDIEAGKYSLKEFYIRRIRRILPALSAVLAFTMIGAWGLFLPSDLETVGMSVIATSLFVSNILFWRTINYFDTSAEVNPLLHTWSLAVEEQFYIFFPILLFLIWQLGWNRKVILVILFFGSLALSIIALRFFETATFYLLPTRAWEMLLGAILASNLFPSLKRKGAQEGFAGLGLFLIIGSILFIDKNMPFPGEAALPVCIGVGLIIYAGTGAYQTLTNRLLSLRPMIGIGLISYSLYLWHWPIFIFAKYYLMRDLLLEEIFILLSVTVLLSILSWKYIEQPFRTKSSRVYSTRPKIIFTVAGLVIAVTIAAGLALSYSQGFPERFSEKARQFEAGQNDISPSREKCHSLEETPVTAEKSCLYGAEGQSEELIIWGDSHAVEIAYAIGEGAKELGKSVRHMSHSSCTPTLGYEAHLKPGCIKALKDYRDFILFSSRASKVLLIAYFGPSMEKTSAGAYLDAIERNVKALHDNGKTIFILKPVPTSPVNIPRALALTERYGRDPSHTAISLEEYQNQNKEIISFLEKLSVTYNVILIDPAQALCQNGSCSVMDDEKTLYFDNHHLSLSGARKMAPLYKQLFE